MIPSPNQLRLHVGQDKDGGNTQECASADGRDQAKSRDVETEVSVPERWNREGKLGGRDVAEFLVRASDTVR